MTESIREDRCVEVLITVNSTNYGLRDANLRWMRIETILTAPNKSCAF